MEREIIKKENEYSYKIKITPAKGRKDKKPFIMQCFDVRDQRHKVNVVVKEDNIRRGSKFIRASVSIIGRPYN